MDKPKSRWRLGKNRWIVLALIIAGIIFSFVFPPARPIFEVVPEPITGVLFTLPRLGPISLTNTTFTLAIVSIIPTITYLSVSQTLSSSNLPPSRLPNRVIGDRSTDRPSIRLSIISRLPEAQNSAIGGNWSPRTQMKMPWRPPK